MSECSLIASTLANTFAIAFTVASKSKSKIALKMFFAIVSLYKPLSSVKNTFRVSLSPKNTSTNLSAPSIKFATSSSPFKRASPKVPACSNAITFATACILSECSLIALTLTTTLAIALTVSSKSKSKIALKMFLAMVSLYKPLSSSKNTFRVSLS